MIGCYLLIIELKDDLLISIGRIGKKSFKQGYYVYVGSALNGLEQRIERHLRSNKNVHWHIDYLLKHAHISDIFYKKSIYKEECDVAKLFDKNHKSVKGFGCSDCDCESHLFYGSKESISANIIKLQMKRYLNAKT
jgi:Uri superfamily endonuclease